MTKKTNKDKSTATMLTPGKVGRQEPLSDLKDCTRHLSIEHQAILRAPNPLALTLSFLFVFFLGIVPLDGGLYAAFVGLVVFTPSSLQALIHMGVSWGRFDTIMLDPFSNGTAPGRVSETRKPLRARSSRSKIQRHPTRPTVRLWRH